MRVSEIFGPVIQGEGSSIGYPVTFVRLSGCNLTCKFCDTKYHKNGDEMSIQEVAKRMNKGVENIVITGGEPMLQREEMFELMRQNPQYKYFLETNGTIFDIRMNLFTKVSCSPKKEVKTVGSYRQIANLYNSTFKFVYEDGQDKWWENVISEAQIPKERVYIMPEGANRKEQIKKMPEVMEYCAKNGYKFGARLHVLAYDLRRGV